MRSSAIARGTKAGIPAIAPRTGVAVIGCGYWGMNYVRVFHELQDAWLPCVCDEREARLEDVQSRYPGTFVTSHLDEALDAPGVDAVVIATEASTHLEIATHALEAGKHVLIEKPLTTEVEDADRLIALAEANGVVLLVGHTFIYNDGVRKVKEYVDGSYLGDLYYLYARRTSLGPIRGDVNVVWDLAPHDVAIFNFLLGGEPDWVSAVGARVLGNGHEDVGFIALGYPNGVIGHIHVSWAEPNKVREVVVVGSDRRVVFNDVDVLERVRVFDKGVKVVPADEPTTFGEFQFVLRDGDILSPALGTSEPLKNQCAHFLECVRGGVDPFTSGAQGRAVVAVMSAIDRSIALNGAPVPVRTPLPAVAVA
jgi:predicted dehydrogenase